MIKVDNLFWGDFSSFNSNPFLYLHYLWFLCICLYHLFILQSSISPKLIIFSAFFFCKGAYCMLPLPGMYPLPSITSQQSSVEKRIKPPSPTQVYPDEPPEDGEVKYA